MAPNCFHSRSTTRRNAVWAKHDLEEGGCSSRPAAAGGRISNPGLLPARLRIATAPTGTVITARPVADVAAVLLTGQLHRLVNRGGQLQRTVCSTFSSRCRIGFNDSESRGFHQLRGRRQALFSLTDGSCIFACAARFTAIPHGLELPSARALDAPSDRTARVRASGVRRRPSSPSSSSSTAGSQGVRCRARTSCCCICECADLQPA